MYCNERLLLAYYYKQPPAYDLELHKSVLKHLSRAPLFMLVNGYWAMSNRQIFSGISKPKTYTHEPADPEHGYWPLYPDHSLAILIVLSMLAIHYTITSFDIVNQYYEKWLLQRIVKVEGEIDFDE